MSVRIGAHVDQTDPVAEARAVGLDAAQFFLGDPQGWKAPSVAFEGGAGALRQAAEDADVHLYVHAPYVINVASPNNRIRIPSRKLLQQTLTTAAGIGAKGVIVHGGHVTANDDVAVGFDNWRKCIDGLDIAVPLLIENTAGGTRAMARHLESIERLWAAISQAQGFDNVGLCLDTCHAHAGGNDLHGLVERILAITGRIDLIHANDSRDAFNSGADRHASIGNGQVDLAGLAEVVRTAQATLVLETPGDGHEGDIAWLRQALEG